MAGMLNNSNAPWWGPARPMIVADPGKLTFFARANAVRAGVRGGVYGALSGLGDIVGNRIVPVSVTGSTSPGGELGRDWTFDPEVIYGDATASGSADSSALDANGTSTIDRWFNRFNSVLKSMLPGQQPAPAATATEPLWPTVLVIGAVGVGALMLMKKKAR